MESICSIDECGAPVRARGYCTRHYTRFNRHGDPLYRERQDRVGPCKVGGCDAPILANGYCKLHYNRWLAKGDPGPVGPLRRSSQPLCDIEGCTQPHVAQGWCEKHYTSWQKYGDPLEVSRRREQEHRVCHVPGCERLGSGRGLIDRASGGLCGMHYQRMRKYGQVDLPKRAKGHLDRDGYRLVRSGGRRIREHRLVMERLIGRPLWPDENVHHRNGVRDDNRPENLELWARPQPTKARVTDLVAWARQIITDYGSLVDEGVLT